MVFYKIPLTDKELLIFQKRIQQAKNDFLVPDEYDYACIAYALSTIACLRRPFDRTCDDCVMELMIDTVHLHFTEEEVKSIVLACLGLDNEHDNETIKSVLPKETVEKLSGFVPVCRGRLKPKIRDFLQ